MKLSDVAWAVAGGVTWTASEYLIHRFIGHGKPRVAAPVWMVDDAGEIRPEHAADYELVGPRKDAKQATATAQPMVS